MYLQNQMISNIYETLSFDTRATCPQALLSDATETDCLARLGFLAA